MKNRIKEKIKKVIASVVVFANVVTNFSTIGVSIASDELVEESTANALISAEINKYVNYDIEEEKGVLMEFDISSGLETPDDVEYSPIITSNLDVTLPEIDGIYPSKVVVISESTLSTNGKEEVEYVNYTYDTKTGELSVINTNSDIEETDTDEMYRDNNNGQSDELRVLAYYAEETYTKSEDDRKIKIELNIIQELENGNRIEETKSLSTVLSSDISNIVSSEVSSSEIYNGYINANINNSSSYETEYEENVEINISLENLSDKITITSEDSFLDSIENTVTTNGKTEYIETRINKQEFLEIFGEDGTLKIFSEDVELFEINKDTEAVDGMIILTYENNVQNIEIVTSTAIKVGSLNILNTKKINEEMLSSKVTSIAVDSEILLDTKDIIETGEEETYTNIYNEKFSSTLEIKESTTSIDVTIDKTNLTNEMQNDLNINIELLSSSAKYDLYKNPVIEIELPKEVEKVVIGDVSILYAKGLELGNIEVIEEEENKVLKISLEGVQEEYYLDQILTGTQVLIPVSLILEKEFTEREDSLKITYSNEVANTIDYEVEGKEYKEIAIYLESIKEETNEDEDQVIVPDVSITEEQAQNIDIDISAKIGSSTLENGASVYEKQIITYKVEFTNNNETAINGIDIVANIPEGVEYVTDIDLGTYYAENYEYITDDTVREGYLTIDTLKAGESTSVTFEVVVSELEENVQTKDIELIIDASVGETILDSKSMKNTVQVAAAETFLKSYIGRLINNAFYYEIYITNNTDEVMENITVSFDQLPEEITLDDSGCVLMYGESGITDNSGIVADKDATIKDESYENNQYSAIINELDPGVTIILSINGIANKFSYDSNEVLLDAAATITLDDGSIYYTNENRRYAYPQYVTATMTSLQEGEDVKYDEEVTYTITIKNESKVRTSVNIADYLPDELETFNLVSYNQYQMVNSEDYIITYDLEQEANIEWEVQEVQTALDSTDGTPNLDISILLPAGEEIEINLVLKAGIVQEKTEVSNYATITGTNIPTITTNTIKFNIIPIENEEDDEVLDDPSVLPEEDGNSDDDIYDEEAEDGKLAINGLAWIDANSNGKKDTTEELLEGMTVKLYSVQTSSLVIDNDGNICQTTTANDGTYSFNNLSAGQYLVLFKYDNTSYYVTEYQKSGVNEDVNSDAIYKTVTIDGNPEEVGITDIIEISNTNKTNIDIGLIKNEKVDFSLEKYISKVTTVDNEETTVYEYTDTQLAKIEIDDDKLLDTTLEIQYKFVITNEGNTSGIISEIVDDLDTELKFDSQSNTNWSMSSNNTLTYVGLGGTQIAPGETKEIYLTVTTELTENSIGTIENSAEINKVYISSGNSDIDSTPGNGSISEDDYSKASLIVGIETGNVQTILVIVLGITGTFGLVIFILKNKNSKNKNAKKVGLMLVTLISVIGIFNITTYAIDIGIVGGNATDGWDFTGEYECVSSGLHQCSHTWHEYTYSYPTDRVTTSTTSELKPGYSSSLSVSGNVSLNSNNLLGEYVIYAGYGGSLSVTVNYEKMDGSTGSTSGNSDITLTDSSGNSKSAGSLGDGGSFSFYIKTSDDVRAITSVQAYIYISQVRITTYTYTQTDIYTCTSMDPIAANHGSDCLNGIQDMGITTTGGYSITDDGVAGASNGTKYFVRNSGELYVNKTDSHTNWELSGIKFIVKNTSINKYIKSYTYSGETCNGKQLSYVTFTSNRSEAYVFEIPSTSGMTLYNIPIGNYTVEEVGYGSTVYATHSDGKLYTYQNLNLDYYLNSTAYATSITQNNTSGVTIVNDRKEENLLFIKEDSRTGERMDNISFIIKDADIGKYIKSYTAGNPSTLTYTTNASEAQVFVTDENGEIYLQNIIVSNYEVTEVAVSDYWYQYYDVDTTVRTFKLNGAVSDTVKVTTQFTFKNTQIYMDISGYVWEELISGKTSTINGFYDEDDLKIEGITVRLYSVETGELLETKTTDENGAYIFKRYEVTDDNTETGALLKYRVEFEYNGLRYAVVDSITTEDIGSKVEDASRDELNEVYETISGGNDKTLNETLGYSENSNGIDTTELAYETEGYTSTLIQNQNYNPNSYNIDAVGSNTLVDTITADNVLNNYDVVFSDGLKEFEYVNMGIKEREQIDLAVTNDIQEVNMSINGYEHTYEYAGRDIYLDLFASSVEDLQNKYPSEGEDSTYSSMTYQRDVYDSYIGYTELLDSEEIEGEIEDALEIYVTYKVSITNQSTNLYGYINQVSMYYDDRYTLVEATLENGSNLNCEVLAESGEYERVVITEMDSVEIEAQSREYIYVTFELERDAIIELAKLETTTLDNIVEIDSYSTKSLNSNGNLETYASIDTDSAPDNLEIEYTDDDTNNKNDVILTTFEDDTDIAPGFAINNTQTKSITGTVFVDGTTGELMTGEERLGDGVYEADENIVTDVKVELLEVDDNNVIGGQATLYKTNSETGVATDYWSAETSTDGLGQYSFIGAVPEKYVIRFTYGDGTYIYSADGTLLIEEATVQNYKSTISTASVEEGYDYYSNAWYLQGNVNGVRYSDAYDDYSQRLAINEYVNDIDNGINYGALDQYINEDEYKSITADTNVIDLAIESLNNETSEEFNKENNTLVLNDTAIEVYPAIDFGIVERPRQSLEVTKEISYIKLVLANGQTIIEGDPRVDELTSLIYPTGGSLKIEMDTEIIQSAQLIVNYEISVTNNSEINYDTEEYYMYGTNEQNAEIMVTSIEQIIEYIDEEVTLSTASINNEWEISSMSELKNNNLISEDVYNSSKDRSNVFVNTGTLIGDIKVEETKRVEIQVSKVLSPSIDEMQYDNVVEIGKFSNSVGRTTYEATVGNYILGEENTEEVDTSEENGRATVIITPPTGQTRIYYLLGISSLIILGVGVFLIKKKVLVKNKR